MTKRKLFLSVICYLLFVIYWCFTIRAVFTGGVAGNFRPLQLSQEYVTLKDILVNDATPSRTLWIPQPDKFVYASEVHPVLSSDELFQHASLSAMTDIIQTPQFEKTIRESGIGYVIVPNDLEKKYFLSDYTFDPELRHEVIAALDATPFHPVAGFDSLKVYRSDHDPMIINYPENLPKLQYYANIGTLASGVTLFAIFGFFLVKRK
jgi:hypothetical protein